MHFYYLFLLIILSCTSTSIVPDKFEISFVKNLEEEYVSGNPNIFLNSPVLTKDSIITAVGDKVSAFSIPEGKLLWQFTESEAKYFFATPVTTKSNVIYGSASGVLTARNFNTGNVVFQVNLDAPIASIGNAVSGRIPIHTRDHQIILVDEVTGKILWVYKRQVNTTTSMEKRSVPVIYKNRVYVGFADGYVTSLTLEEGSPVWEYKVGNGKFLDVLNIPFILNNYIYIGAVSGNMVKLNLNGKLVKRFNFNTVATPLVVGKNILIAGDTGDLYLIDSKDRIVKKKKIYSGPIVSIKGKDSFIFATFKQELFKIDNDWNLVSKFDLGTSSSAVYGELVVSNGLVSLISSRGRLYLFKGWPL